MHEKTAFSSASSTLATIVRFALPTLATLVLTQLFNTADAAIVGRVCGESAYAAVGATTTPIGFFTELFMGFSIGTTVLISRTIGERNDEKIARGVHTAILLALICGAACAGIVAASARPFLRLTSTPDSILADATRYLTIYAFGMPVYLAYNFVAAIFRAQGRPQVPLVCLSIGGALNVVGNLCFTILFDLGVTGVALSTVLANTVSLVLLVSVLARERGALRFSIRRCRIDRGCLYEIVRVGLPSGLLGSVFSISNLCVQSSINSLGEGVIAASSAAANIEIYVQYVGNAVSQACIALVGQSFGARDFSRCERIFRTALLSCMIATGTLSVLAYAASDKLLLLFCTSPAIIAAAKERMRFTLLFKILQCVMDISSSVLQGFGKATVPACISLLVVCGFRVVWIFTVFAHVGTLGSLMIVYPISWCFAGVSDLVYFKILMKALKRGVPTP